MNSGGRLHTRRGGATISAARLLPCVSHRGARRPRSHGAGSYGTSTRLDHERPDSNGPGRERHGRVPLRRTRSPCRADHGDSRDDGTLGLRPSSTPLPGIIGSSSSTTPGSGATTRGGAPLTIGQMGNDTASMIRALRLRHPDVLGWSMGGMVAQALAHDHPRLVRRLVLAATAPGDGEGTLPTSAALAPLAGARGGTSGVLDSLFPPGQKAATQRYIAGSCRTPMRCLWRSQTLIQEQLAASAGWFAGRDPSSFDPARLRLRVLIGAGSVDPLIPVANDRYLARRMRRAKLLAYPGRGARIPLSEADVVRRARSSAFFASASHDRSPYGGLRAGRSERRTGKPSGQEV